MRPFYQTYKIKRLKQVCFIYILEKTEIIKKHRHEILIGCYGWPCEC